MMYREAANVIKDSKGRIGSIKSLIFNGNHKNPKQLFGLTHETLKYGPVLDAILEKTKLLSSVKALHSNQWLCRVLVYELLFGKGIRGKYKSALAGYHSQIQAELARLKVKAKVASNEELLLTFQKDSARVNLQTARYVRINTLKVTSVSDVITVFKETYSFISTQGISYEKYISTVKGLMSTEFTQDINIPEVLVFATGTQLHKHQLYKDGKIIIQDKASCLPSYVLSTLPLETGAHCIDCCAAPGNKTSHLAAVLSNKGQIFAFDKDGQRASSMKTLLQTAGATCVNVAHSDFLKVKVSAPKYSRVSVAVVDPSCSGSGIVSRLSELTDSPDSCSKARLANLAKFQAMILKHALSFPALQYAVYSTCSVHEEENEAVVKEIMDALGHVYELVNIVPEIPHRGLTKYPDIGSKCMRLSPQKDCTNGFFVACFKRKNAPTVHLSNGGTETKVSGGSPANEVEKDLHQPPKPPSNKKRKLDNGDTSTGKDGHLNSSGGHVKKRKRKDKRKDNTLVRSCSEVHETDVFVQGLAVGKTVKTNKKKRNKNHGHKKPVTGV